MFPGMFMRKPDKAAALKQLKAHVAMFRVWMTVVRVTPYVLHYLADEKDELKLEF
ncbi:mitochondrial import receptor subunit TOM6 homolog [Hibiscus syriacus]|uniref:mitochondrial import receptor subunit TOM6 homolog n=1 Tax=Hibiscus syriacus TaxID=106335 RepID=UPI0019245B0D|nr:mitochondrial import receptor subunit TOM6 homolog [Hibiscus syriacus]